MNQRVVTAHLTQIVMFFRREIQDLNPLPHPLEQNK